jgi:hypothetical protein
MAQVQNHDVVSASYCGPDRRRSGVVKIERWTIALVRSRWVASFVVAVIVSYCFHILEDRQDQRLEHQQRITLCVIDTVAKQQQVEPDGVRVSLRPILEGCEKHRGK